MQQGSASAGRPAHLLTEASNLDLSCISPPPGEFHVENLRRRGIDVLKISWPGQLGKKSSWLARLGLAGWGRSKSLPWTLTFVDQKIRVDEPDNRNRTHVSKVVPYSDVRSIELISQSGKPTASVRIGLADGELVLGSGLPKASARWLRDRILLETAGLAWRPIHNVGRRTTRATVNPDQEAYRQWNAGPNRLVSLFLEHAPLHVLSLEEALARGDLLTVRQNAHWLKSSCAAVGAALLSELLQRLEIDIDIKSGADVSSLVTHISSEFRKVTGALTRLNEQVRTDGQDQPSDSGSPPSPAQPGPLAGVRMLLVEDSLVNQELARECLTEAGCNVDTANDGRQAISCVNDKSFDIILMDCQMSGMDGFNATRSIRNLEMGTGRPRVPIIALTAHALLGDRELCISAGMDDYLSKPFLEDDLIAKIKKWLPVAQSRPEDGIDHAPTQQTAA